MAGFPRLRGFRRPEGLEGVWRGFVVLEGVQQGFVVLKSPPVVEASLPVTLIPVAFTACPFDSTSSQQREIPESEILMSCFEDYSMA